MADDLAGIAGKQIEQLAGQTTVAQHIQYQADGRRVQIGLGFLGRRGHGNRFEQQARRYFRQVRGATLCQLPEGGG